MAHIFRNNFTGGEISPEILMRPDLDVYQTGLAKCENFVVKPQGGVESRPGSEHCYTFRGNTPLRLIPFIFSAQESYVLAFSTKDFTVFRDGRVVTDTNGDEVVVSLPYELAEAEVAALDYAQSADVMTITVPGKDPIDVRRMSDSSWSSSLVDFTVEAEPPEFLDRAISVTLRTALAHNYVLKDGGYTITQDSQDPAVYHWSETFEYTATSLALDTSNYRPVSFETGTPVEMETFTAGVNPPQHLLGLQTFATPVFNADKDNPARGFLVDEATHDDVTKTGTTSDPNREPRQTYEENYEVMTTFDSARALGGGAGSHRKTYRYVLTAVYESGDESRPSDLVEERTGALSQTHGIKLVWKHPEPEKVDYYRVYKSDTGRSGSFGWIGDAENQQFTDFNLAPVTSDAPPERTVAPSAPGCVTFYQQRQVFGNLQDAPLTFVSSKTARPFNFRQSRPIQDDDAFSVTAATPEFNQIQYLVPLNSLLVLTTGSELRSTEGISEAFTASNTGIRRLSAEGCARVKPSLAGSTLIYVQASGKRFRSLRVAQEGGYTGSDLTTLARHLFEDEAIHEISFSDEPHGTLWCVNEAGTIRTLTYLEGQKVTAWQRHQLAAAPGETAYAASVASVPEGDEAPVYMLALRGSGGSITYTLERLKYRPGVFGTDAWAQTSSASPTTEFQLPDHLAGRDVTVVADDLHVGTRSVASDGTLTLPYEASTVRAGFPYQSTIELPPIASADIQRDLPKGVNEATVFVRDTNEVRAGVLPDLGGEPEMWPAYPKAVGTAYQPKAQYTGPLKIDVGGPWAVDSVVRVAHDLPFKAELLAVEVDVDV